MRSYPYQVLGTEEREESLFFMLESLLRSRIETGEETLDDEDVNVYLAALLHSFMDRSFYRDYGDAISHYDTDVFALAEESGDMRARYRVYKGNADYSLMTTGVFEGLGRRMVRRRWARAAEEEAVERGKLYYRFASDCHARLSRKRSGVAAVLEKLSERFEVYAKILTHMRTEYLTLLRRLSRGELFHLQREAHEGAIARVASEGRDRFLDAYADWLNSGSDADRDRVNALGEALSKIDPEFRFGGI